MSWLRSAVSKAVEASGTVKTYAENVSHAVAEGAKIIQDRIGVRNFKSLKRTVKRLEEAAVSCRGLERTHLLSRWLAALKEIERVLEGSADTSGKSVEQTYVSDKNNLSSPRRDSLVLFCDSDSEDEPMNFRDVFLHSRALEAMTVSMILDAPNDAEVSLLLEIFKICLVGGKEVHNAVVSSIQDLAKVFSSYQDEVLVKRDELLQFARGAITGLKLNADLSRIHIEASALQKKLQSIKDSIAASEKGETASVNTSTTIEALKKTLAEVRLCAKLEVLLMKKKHLNNGDTPEVHGQKVDKLKVLSDSLANSSVKAEKRISDHRHQKEEALNFRMAKANEVSEVEKELGAEIAVLEKQRDELEAELKKVNDSLTAIRARLHNTREERDQFNEASNQLVLHLKAKEEDLSRSIASCKVEAEVVTTWINFLEDTWHLQSSYTEQKEKQANDDLEKCGNYFVNVVSNHLSAYEKALGHNLSHIRECVDHLKKLNERVENGSSPDVDFINQRKALEEEYLESETKTLTVFRVADNMKEQFYYQQGNKLRQEDSKVRALFDAIELIKKEFEAIERPMLDIEVSSSNVETPDDESSHKAFHLTETIDVEESTKEESPGSTSVSGNKSHVKDTIDVEPLNKTGSPKSSLTTTGESLDHEAELAKLESEFGSLSRHYVVEEVGGWEFDELERELKPSQSPSNK